MWRTIVSKLHGLPAKFPKLETANQLCFSRYVSNDDFMLNRDYILSQPKHRDNNIYAKFNHSSIFIATQFRIPANFCSNSRTTTTSHTDTHTHNKIATQTYQRLCRHRRCWLWWTCPVGAYMLHYNVFKWLWSTNNRSFIALAVYSIKHDQTFTVSILFVNWFWCM